MMRRPSRFQRTLRAALVAAGVFAAVAVAGTTNVNISTLHPFAPGTDPSIQQTSDGLEFAPNGDLVIASTKDRIVPDPTNGKVIDFAGTVSGGGTAGHEHSFNWVANPSNGDGFVSLTGDPVGRTGPDGGGLAPTSLPSPSSPPTQVPLPAAAWMGLSTLGALGIRRKLRAIARRQ